MKKQLVLVVLFTLTIPHLSTPATAQMKSPSFRIWSSATSSGGGESSSDSYRINGTIGQSTPIMDPADPPHSASYYLYPGFWHTLDNLLSAYCDWDNEPDGDVDGADMFELILTPFDSIDMETFAIEFGTAYCWN